MLLLFKVMPRVIRHLASMDASMSSWQRWSQRQQELDQGADAGLIRDNRRKFWWSGGLLGLALLLGYLVSKNPDWGLLRSIMKAIAIVLGIAGFVVWNLARQERWFLSSPDPEKPPSIFKE